MTRTAACLTLLRKDMVKGMALKPPIWQVLKNPVRCRELYLLSLLCKLLQPCVQMDADADNHGEEGITFPGVDAHIMKMVII